MTTGRRVLFAGILLALGSMPVLGAFDIGPYRPEDIRGPAWLGIAAGAVFIAAALGVLVGGALPLLAELMGILVLFGFAGIGNWIAFGAGDRICSGSLLLFGLDGGTGIRGLGCRIPFGIGALIVNGLLLWALVVLVQKLAGGPPRRARLRSIAEGVVLACLAPLLLPLLLFVLVAAGFGALRTRFRSGQWPRNESMVRRRLRDPPGGDG